MSINFTLFKNEKGTWCVLFPGTLADMPGNNKLQALNHVANMLRETQLILESMIIEETKPDALEKPIQLGVMHAALSREAQDVPVSPHDGLLRD